MKSIFRLIVCLLLLVGWSLAALSLHVIRTPGEIPITLIPKESFSVRDTWVDTTKWTLDSVGEHPALVEKLLRTGKTDVLKHVIADKGADVSSQLSDALVRAQRRDRSKPTQPTTVGQNGGAQGLLGWLSFGKR